MSIKNNPIEPLIIERIFNAPIAQVWKAITNVEDMRRWYFDLKEFKPQVGFEFQFVCEHEGVKYDHRCRVTDVVSEKRIAYTWRYEGREGDSLVTFELFPEGSKTRLKLTHEGLETFPKHPSFARESFTEGWSDFIGAQLKNYVESDTADREILITREFNAPRELVWEAWTDAKHIGNWWGPRGFKTTTLERNFKPGGIWRYTMHGPDGTDYPNRMVYHEITKPERIVCTLGSDEEPDQFRQTVTFEDVGGKTRVTMRAVFPSVEACESIKKFGVVEGGQQHVERFGEHLAETMSKPFVISREFNAPRNLVWKAWTEEEHLKGWFGPKSFAMTTAKQDFRPGGIFHYRLQAPDGKEMWGKFVYREIVPSEKIKWVNSFSDKDGAVTRHPFSDMMWPLQILCLVTFAESNGKTIVTIKSFPLDATDEERKTFEDGHASMNQGWTGTLEKLASHLERVV